MFSTESYLLFIEVFIPFRFKGCVSRLKACTRRFDLSTELLWITTNLKRCISTSYNPHKNKLAKPLDPRLKLRIMPSSRKGKRIGKWITT